MITNHPREMRHREQTRTPAARKNVEYISIDNVNAPSELRDRLCKLLLDQELNKVLRSVSEAEQ